MSILTLSHIQMIADASAAEHFKNIVEKGEIAHNEQFLLFATTFSTLLNSKSYIY